MIECDTVILGLGYVGLPTAILIASKNIKVHGVDVNTEIVDLVNSGKIHIEEPGLDKLLNKVLQNGNLEISSKPTQASNYLVVVPTPFDDDLNPDISYIKAAANSILGLLKEGDLFIVESTSPVGTTEKIKDYIYHKRPELENKIHVAYCPERVLPGNVIDELVENDRVVGGVGDKATKEAVQFYQRFVKGIIHETDSRTAEMCKLVENSSRDNQIAFANELSMICDQAGINIRELIDLANKHPRVNILNPGAGVGGHCIAVDPYFIISEFPKDSELISQARKTNNKKANWCANKIINEAIDFEDKNKRKAKVYIFGLAYKPNVNDIRCSPSMKIAKMVKETKCCECYVVEPHLEYIKGFQLVEINDAIAEADIVCFLVAHDKFKGLIYSKSVKILDFVGLNI